MVCVEEKILKIIVESGKIERIFNELEEKLFNYKTSYDNKKYNTETFDYCMFRYYQGKIRLLLILIKNEMIEDEKTENLVKRCKKILEMDFTDEETSRNYFEIYNYFEKDKDLFEWLKQVNI